MFHKSIGDDKYYTVFNDISKLATHTHTHREKKIVFIDGLACYHIYLE